MDNAKNTNAEIGITDIGVLLDRGSRCDEEGGRLASSGKYREANHMRRMGAYFREQARILQTIADATK